MRSDILVALALLAGSCGVGEVDDIAVPADGPLPAEALGRCLSDGPRESPANYEGWKMLLPGAWVRVDAIDPDGARARRAKAFAGTYVVLGGDSDVVARLTPAPAKVTLDGYAAKAADAALRAGAAVYLHHDAGGVRFALAIRGDEFTYLGDCGADDATALRRYLGAATLPYLRSFLGKPSREVKRLLGYPPDADPKHLEDWWSGLGPHSPPGVLAALRKVRLSVEAPGVRRENALLCFWIPLGGSGCTDVRDPKPATLYVDPGRTKFDVVVRTPGSPRKEQRGTLDLRWAARRGGVRLTDQRPMLLTVTLSANPKRPYQVDTAVLTPCAQRHCDG